MSLVVYLDSDSVWKNSLSVWYAMKYLENLMHLKLQAKPPSRKLHFERLNFCASIEDSARRIAKQAIIARRWMKLEQKVKKIN